MALNITNGIYHHKKEKNLVDSLLLAVSLVLLLLPIPVIASILLRLNLTLLALIWLIAIYVVSYGYVRVERLYIQRKYWIAVVAMQSLAAIILVMAIW
ncbi:hypothetical protein [Candidatus Mancarchaeum acidiphilum]|uniref:hypothetical protein n=1 Tax=Candidatus Mancarchaeum acidiphilum TaxID=1920749 RepID=UPI000B58CBE7|nr:hypothetical protein [Candidatus Mancarchaeum acidiphilum]